MFSFFQWSIVSGKQLLVAHLLQLNGILARTSGSLDENGAKDSSENGKSGRRTFYQCIRFPMLLRPLSVLSSDGKSGKWKWKE